MKGKYSITISNNKCSFTMELKRNITIVKGNSGTGKTTLIQMLKAWSEHGRKSGIHCKSNVDFVIFDESTDWELKLNKLHNVIVFMDEGLSYVRSKEFARRIQSCDCYFVIVTRTSQLKSLSYSVREIYNLTEDGKKGKLTYNSIFTRYSDKDFNMKPDLVITEDSNSGYELMQLLFDCDIISARGNSNVKASIEKNMDKYKSIFVIVDGACFGAYVQDVLNLAKLHGNMCVFTEESFEYLVLNTNYLNNKVTSHVKGVTLKGEDYGCC